ncbi:MAG: hypothetical protein ACYTG6_04535 [Planctomycetota bacterium]
MKPSPVSLLACLAIVAAFVLPSAPALSDEVAPPSPASFQGRVLSEDAESDAPVRLLVEVGPATRVDRGPRGSWVPGQVFVGTYRYWEEPAGRMLYLYDDVQNLVARVVDPAGVMVLAEPSAE